MASNTVEGSTSASVRRSALDLLRSKTLTWASVAAALVAMVAGIFGAFFTTARPEALGTAYIVTATNERIAALTKDLAELQRQNQQLSEQLKNISPKGTSLPNADVAKLTVRLGSVETQLKALDDAIDQTPDKILAVPILRKDLDDLKDSYRQNVTATQVQIDRVYDQNKWFIGLMITMAVGLLTLAVGNILQLRK